MRQETLQNKLNKAIERWMETKDNSQIKSLIPCMEKQWNTWAKKEEDFRSGDETYGYASEESIANNMLYISDRWRCACRIKWIIDGVENGSI